MTQVTIVGGGIVGTTIAYELSHYSDFEITLVERDYPASASTGAALGLLIGVSSHKTKGQAWALRDAGLRRYPTLLSELTAQTGETIPTVQGLLHLCFDAEEMTQWEQLGKIRHSQGWNLEIWDPKQLHQVCPYLDTSQIVGAIYSPDDFQVNPKALTNVLVTAGKQNGVTYYWGAKITGVSTRYHDAKQRCHIVYSNQGSWETDYLIVAAGLGSFPLTQHLQQPVSLNPVLGQAMRVRLEHNLSSNQPVITGEDVHLIPLGNGEYWIGATVEFPDEQGNVEAQQELLHQVKDSAIAYCPALADAEVLETWSGKRPRPEGQAAPVIEYLQGYENVIVATGHYRNGILLAPGTAQKVIQMIAESQPG